MRQLAIVFRREYVERVRSKSFIISTLLTPLFLSFMVLGPMLSERLASSDVYHITVVDETEEVGSRVVAALNDIPDESERIITAEGTVFPDPDTRDALSMQVANGQIDGFLWIPADIATSNQAQLVLHEDVSGRATERLNAVLSGSLQFWRLRRAGVAEQEAALLFRPVALDVQEIGEQGQEEQRPGGFLLAFILGFTLYFLILLYGVQVMQSVQEEKTSRIAEVLVSSVRPMDLMLGKVLGVGAVALTQVAIWVLFARGALNLETQLARMGLPPNAMGELTRGITIPILLMTLAYLVLGFFLYATLFAAAGAAAGSPEDAQRFTFPLILPLMIPIFMLQAIIESPNGTTAVLLNWIPFTAPLVAPMRIGAGGGTPLEMIGSLLVLASAVVGVGWVAGKVYRIGILSAGTRPSIPDLIRWIRMA